MLTGFLQLLSFLLAGEIVVHLAALPLPGPVVGMALLLAWLLRRGSEPSENLGKAASGILQFLSLLFVPAGVGIILHLERLQREWPAILGSVVFATLISVALTALLLRRLSAGKEQSHD
ncbi:murein hydrolase transporter LrgA [Betaproteobacteria bacterium]|nr:murein hydrolase transporter LrgA [Betaproteobacteria bacterium]